MSNDGRRAGTSDRDQNSNSLCECCACIHDGSQTMREKQTDEHLSHDIIEGEGLAHIHPQERLDTHEVQQVCSLEIGKECISLIYQNCYLIVSLHAIIQSAR